MASRQASIGWLAGAALARPPVEKEQHRENEVGGTDDDWHLTVLIVGERRQREAQQRQHGEEHDSAINAHQPITLTLSDTTAAINAAPGIVTSQATTTRPAIVQRTADIRFDAPTPMIAPVIVWVVDTGMPAYDV